jgi:CRISPR type III-associated protein (TIGR04423 family)
MKKIQLSEIDFSTPYSGYYWYSNNHEPIVFEEETLSPEAFTKLPFIVEGYLFSKKDGGVCINIKNIQGEYYLFQVNLKEIDKTNLEKYTFLASSDFSKYDIKKFRAIQYWSPEQDDLCEGMEVLKPTWIAFEGFDK